MTINLHPSMRTLLHLMTTIDQSTVQSLAKWITDKQPGFMSTRPPFRVDTRCLDQALAGEITEQLPHPWKLAYLDDFTEFGNTGSDMVLFPITCNRSCTLDGASMVMGHGYEVKRGTRRVFTSQVYFVYFEYPAPRPPASVG